MDIWVANACYDLSTIAGNEIVKDSKSREKFVTLEFDRDGRICPQWFRTEKISWYCGVRRTYDMMMQNRIVWGGMLLMETNIRKSSKSRTSRWCFRKIWKGLDLNNAKAAIDRARCWLKNRCRWSCRRKPSWCIWKRKETGSRSECRESMWCLKQISEEEMLGYFEKSFEYIYAEAKEVIAPTSDMIYSDFVGDLQKKLQDFTDMTIFRQHFKEINNRKIIIQNCVR